MLYRGILALLVLAFTIITFVACDVTSEKALDESLEPVPNVTAIEGAENASVRVNNGTTSNFTVDIQNVEWNTLISNGEREAYCIAWKDPISRNDAIYEEVGVYSTEDDEKFADINRLFSIKNELMNNDPELTWREIQVAIWVLAPFQDFDMNMPVSELPEEVRSNGQANFDKEKVQFIVDAVLNRSSAKTVEGFDGSADFWSFKKKKTMCVIGTDKDTQSLITPCDETAFAYGGNHDADYAGIAGIPGLDGYANCFPESPFRAPARWGWTNGKLEEGEYEFPLYAGAGLCNLSKGQYSGDVKIDYNDGKASVTFTASDGTSFLETHLHVSNHPLPRLRNGRITLAPGQYASNDDVVSITETEVIYEVNGLDGDVYVIAHAVMSGYLSD
ncbi:hypothetical protein [Rhodohalobacter mucosus]|uniref:Uncharacterized protein n=1 Tax=Rhodohalobacter mucosus TaxID=2079485 RepID=A0A316TVI7_9BACT|nr:hypothetical protein [Rhodohalobacter mucosus]PWN07831.1 hypothetical protein DDZ15_02130 [Rhodohalobacter mucosus]